MKNVPLFPGFAGGDLEAEDFAVAIRVDTGRDQHDSADHPAVFANLHRQRVGCHERERPASPSGRAWNAVT